MNRRFIFAIAASALFGLVAILIFQQILKNRLIVDSQLGQTKIVVAKAKLPAGIPITANQLKTASHEAISLPEGSFLNEKDALGRIPLADVEPNVAITSKNTVVADQAGRLSIRPEYRAMSIRVDEASSVSGFAQPGSVVDVVAVLTPSQNSKPVSKIIVQDLRVLANGRETQIKTDGQTRTGNTVTLEVTQAQANMLALAGREGTLSLILKHPADRGILERESTVVMNDMEGSYIRNQPRTTPTPQPASQFYPTWVVNPTPSPKPTTTPVSTPSPTTKVAAIRVIVGDKPSEVMVRQ